MKKPELLCPAGNFACLNAAINAGADAVYLGLKEFNMRDSAKNFLLRDIDKINKIRKEKKIKVYLTLNTIIYDNEIERINRILKKVKGKIDVVICWDLSVINLCKKNKIPFHISTQASVSNIEAAKFYKKLGAKRITLARELNLGQISKISKIIDVECFVHGALCVAESGRCFTSQLLHKRSANKGRCQHPCRKEYTIKDDEGNTLKVKNNFILSAKDLCTLPFIEKLKRAGITSFKIEGRNRDADYVDAVTSVYREAIDNRISKKRMDELLKKLGEVYNRKFSSGFYLGVPTADDFTDIDGSAGKKKKKIIGKVLNYYVKNKVAVVKVFTNTIKIGDELYIIGDKTGIAKFKVKSMEINHKPVKNVGKGQLVGIKCPRVRENDSVYKV